MTLAIYAKKCDIDEDELREDAFGLLQRYDDMRVEDINRFTKDDIVCALEMFNEDYVTFPRMILQRFPDSLCQLISGIGANKKAAYSVYEYK